MMLTHCGNNVRNRYSGCVFSVKDIVPVPLKTSRNHKVYAYAPSGTATSGCPSGFVILIRLVVPSVHVVKRRDSALSERLRSRAYEGGAHRCP